MYSQGETFYYDIDGDEYELTVVETFISGGLEYLICEDFDEKFYIFYYDEDEDEVVHLEDPYEEESMIKEWLDNGGDNHFNMHYDDDDDYDDDDYDDKDDMDGFHEIDEDEF